MLTKERKHRKKRIQAKIKGTQARPRVSVFRSNKFFYAQLIDDTKGVTLAAGKAKKVQEVAEMITTQAKSKKITQAVYDRSGYRYHGKVRELADKLRENGIKI